MSLRRPSNRDKYDIICYLYNNNGAKRYITERLGFIVRVDAGSPSRTSRRSQAYFRADLVLAQGPFEQNYGDGSNQKTDYVVPA